MMSDLHSPDLNPSTAFVRLGGLSVLIAGFLLAVGYLPTRAVVGAGGVAAMAVGVGIALLATLIGLVPPVLALQQAARERLNGMLLGMAARFVLTVGLLLAALLTGLVDRATLAVWVGIGYVVLIGVDTVGLVWLTRRAAGTRS